MLETLCVGGWGGRQGDLWPRSAIGPGWWRESERSCRELFRVVCGPETWGMPNTVAWAPCTGAHPPGVWTRHFPEEVEGGLGADAEPACPLRSWRVWGKTCTACSHLG